MMQIACDYCGADNAATMFQVCDTNYGFAGAWAVVRCRRCGLVYLNPRPDEDEIGRYYPDEDYVCFKQSQAPAPLGRGHHFIQAAEAVGLQHGRVCDIGCGAGDFLAAAQASGWQTAGVEPNAHARQICRARLPGAPVHASLEQGAFAAGSFDAVTMWHVFEHLSSPSAVLREIGRILKPDGLLGIAVPNFGSLERRIWGRRWIPIDAPRHFFHFEQEMLIRCLEGRGFSVLSVAQNPGANSLAANVLRSFRNLILDPFSPRRTAVNLPNIGTVNDQPGPERFAPGYVVNAAHKARTAQIATRMLYPLAWAIARLGYGPELLIYAQKRQDESRAG